MNFITRSFVILLLLIPHLLEGQQVKIELFEPAKKQSYLPDLYRLSIANNSNEPLECYLILTVEEEDEGMVGVLRSATFNVPEGASRLDASNYQKLEPVDVIQSVPEYEEFTLRTNTLPPGRYEVCATIHLAVTEEPLDKDCYRLNIESYTPPYLISPNDRDTVRENLSFFFWSPASPSTGNMSYQIKIAEVLHMQSPVSAVRSNPAWFKQGEIITPSMQYPEYARELENGQKYAWQVMAFTGGNNIGSSEVWSFVYNPEDTTKEKKDTTAKDYGYYYELSEGVPKGIYNLKEPKLPFLFISQSPAFQPEVKIIDEAGNVIHQGQFNQKQRYGHNKNVVDLTEWFNPKADELYTFSLTDKKGNTYRLRFKYNPGE